MGLRRLLHRYAHLETAPRHQPAAIIHYEILRLRYAEVVLAQVAAAIEIGAYLASDKPVHSLVHEWHQKGTPLKSWYGHRKRCVEAPPV